MRKIVRVMSVVLIVFMISIVGVLSGCGDGGGESKAVTKYKFVRENYAKEMEAKHDAEGREHIAIPEGAETVLVDGIEYNAIDRINRLLDVSANYILSQDVEWGSFNCFYENPFTGRFHGNNYKIYGEKTARTLFLFAENAVIQNVIFSSNTYGVYPESKVARTSLARFIDNSIIKDCINYFQPSVEENQYHLSPMIYMAEYCEITGLINYADFYTSGGGIVNWAFNGTSIKNCKNYGNLVADSYSGNGGIVGSARHGISAGSKEIIIEDCENYGKIIGTSALGGIAGIVDIISSKFDPKNESDYLDTQIIRNCKNFGDIYLLKEEGTARVESVYDRNDIYCIGGIAGNFSIIENCVNEGNFYGLESLGKNLYVDYIGGIAGAAKKVTNSENKGKWEIHKGRAKNVGDILGITISKGE